MHRLKDMTLDVEDFSKIIIIFLVRFITIKDYVTTRSTWATLLS